MTTSQQRSTRATDGSAGPKPARLPGDRHDKSASGTARRALNRVLALFERGQLSATEMRVLLALGEHRDASIDELAEELGSRPTEITRAGRRLAMRGLLRTHYAGRPEQTLMEITPTGLSTMQALLTAAGSGLATSSTPARAVR